MKSVNTLLENVILYNTNINDIEKIKLAYDVASIYHGDQKRQSGEPYITHPLEVAIILSILYADTDTIVAALLHDITKNYTVQKQLKCCEEFGIIIGEYDVDMPKVFHAKTAAAVAERDFADFVDDDIINAIRWHTTGHAKMSLFECIIYLADYIEPTRDFPDCIELREFFYQKVKICTTESERLMLLCDTMVLSIDMTIKNLIAESSLIDRDTVEARNFFINI